MISLSERDFDEFQNTLDWRCALPLPDGRLLGSDKYGNVEKSDSEIVQSVKEHLAPSNKRILELGPCEGIYTVQLAGICREVVSVEIRPKNIISILTRLFIHDINNVKVILGDARDLNEKNGSFDILFHAGLLYHLDNPVEHLFSIAPLAPKILLNTHYCDGEEHLPQDNIEYSGKQWRAGRYQEHGWKDPFSGVESFSRWLYRDDLMEAVKQAGYPNINVINTYRLGPHPRLTLVASR